MNENKPFIPLPEENMSQVELKEPDMERVEELKEILVEQKKIEKISIIKSKLHSYVERIKYNVETNTVTIPEALLNIPKIIDKMLNAE